MNKNTWKIVIRPMGALAAAAILMASVPSWGLAQVQAAAQAQACLLYTSPSPRDRG